MNEYIVYFEFELTAIIYWGRWQIREHSGQAAVERLLRENLLQPEARLRRAEVFFADDRPGMYRLEPKKVESYEVVKTG